MRLAALLLVVACSSSAQAPSGSTTPASPSTPTSTTGSSTVASSPAATTTPGAVPTAAPGKAGRYSCFSYLTGNSTVKRHACMRTDDCGPYLEQAKGVGGIRDVSGCANVAAVYCFHQVPTKDDPEGLDVCQPTLDECKTARSDAVKAKMSVDTDCTQR